MEVLEVGRVHTKMRMLKFHAATLLDMPFPLRGEKGRMK